MKRKKKRAVAPKPVVKKRRKQKKKILRGRRITGPKKKAAPDLVTGMFCIARGSQLMTREDPVTGEAHFVDTADFNEQLGAVFLSKEDAQPVFNRHFKAESPSEILPLKQFMANHFMVDHNCGDAVRVRLCTRADAKPLRVALREARGRYLAVVHDAKQDLRIAAKSFKEEEKTLKSEVVKAEAALSKFDWLSRSYV